MSRVLDCSCVHEAWRKAAGRRQTARGAFRMSAELYGSLVESMTAAADSGTVSLYRRSLCLDTFSRLFLCVNWTSSSSFSSKSLSLLSKVAQLPMSGMCEALIFLVFEDRCDDLNHRWKMFQVWLSLLNHAARLKEGQWWGGGRENIAYFIHFWVLGKGPFTWLTTVGVSVCWTVCTKKMLNTQLNPSFRQEAIRAAKTLCYFTLPKCKNLKLFKDTSNTVVFFDLFRGILNCRTPAKLTGSNFVGFCDKRSKKNLTSSDKLYAAAR